MSRPWSCFVACRPVGQASLRNRARRVSTRDGFGGRATAGRTRVPRRSASRRGREPDRGGASPAAPATLRLGGGARGERRRLGERNAPARGVLPRGTDRRRRGPSPASRPSSRRPTSHVHVAGWHFSPDFALTRDDDPMDPSQSPRGALDPRRRSGARLGGSAASALPAVANGGPADARSPVRRHPHRLRARLEGAPAALPPREDDRRRRPPRVRRRDRPDGGERRPLRLEPARRACPGRLARPSVRLEGPAVADVAEHFRMRWREVTGEALPPARPTEPGGRRGGPGPAHRARARLRVVPRGDFTILEAYVGRCAARALHLPGEPVPLVARGRRILAREARRPPSDGFRLVLSCPRSPTRGTTRVAARGLVEADAGAGRLLACTMNARHASSPIPSTCTRRWGSSTTLADRRLGQPQRALAVQRHRDQHPHHDATLARGTRLRLWSEHLELPEKEIRGDPTEVVERHWKPISAEQLERQQSGLRSPIDSCACRMFRVAPGVCSDRYKAFSSTADPDRDAAARIARCPDSSSRR